MIPMVSIIVPVYNAENNLERCIESILGQTYKEFELILLNDGSTDRSGEICDAYAMKDQRIRVVHKKNTGVSDTRNLGIEMACGEYLQFLDSDDWITPDATGLFVRTATEKQCDMVIADFYRVIGERVSPKGAIEEDGIMDRMTYAVNMLQKPADFYYGVLWNKFYKRSIIQEHQLRMDTSISWCEDFMFNLEYVRRIQTVYALKVPVYYYVKTKGSLVSQGMSMKKTIQMKRNVFSYYNAFYKDVFGEDDYEKRRLQVYRFLFDAAGDGLVSSSVLPGNFKLGNERTNVSEGVQEGKGIFFDSYRERMLQEKLFEAVAIRHDLNIIDVKLLYYLSRTHDNCTYKEKADILNISRTGLTRALQRLSSRELIEAENKTRGKVGHRLREEADPILMELMLVLGDLEQIQYEGFTKEEIALYEKLEEKRKSNIRRALR